MTALTTRPVTPVTPVTPATPRPHSPARRAARGRLLRSTSVAVVATYAYVNPAVAVFLGWLILSEPITSTTILGATVVVAGVALVVASERR